MTLDMSQGRHASAAGTDSVQRIRQRAFAQARRHSMLVRVLRVALPVIALISTGALFLSPEMLLRVFYPAINASVGKVEITTDQLRMINPRFDGFTSDKGHYVVTAKAATQMMDNPNLMRIEQVHGHLVQVDNSWTDITSVAGTYQTQTKAMQLSKGVVITTSTDAKVLLDHADIDVDKKLVQSDAEVAMSMPSGTIKGRGLLVDNIKKQLLLKDDVTAHLIPPPHAPPAGDDGEAVPPDPTVLAPPAAAPGALSFTPTMSDAPVDIDAKQLDVLDSAKTATFTGAVRAVQAGMVLRSDKMVVGYASAPGATPASLTNAGPTAQNLTFVTNSGNVVITTPDGRKAICDNSRYDPKANSMVLSGNVSLSQKTSELHADMVVYDMLAKRTHVTAKNRVAGHFEPDAAQGLATKAGPSPAAGLAGLGASHGATDIAADGLEIDNADNTATFQGTVIVSQHGNKLTGERLEIDMAKRHMAMSGPGRVSGVFTPDAATTTGAKAAKKAPPEPSGGEASVAGAGFASLAASTGDPTSIEADTLNVQDDLGVAVFNGKVLVVRGGDRISAETLTVEYAASGTAASGQAGSQLKQIHAKDHVVVRTSDQQAASSDLLVYDPLHNKMILSGHVTVSQGKNVVRGEKLYVDLLTGNSHFENRDDGASGLSAAPGTPAQAAAPATPSAPPGRAQAIFFPSGSGPAGGAVVAVPPPAAKPKEDMSASDVMVAPDTHN